VTGGACRTAAISHDIRRPIFSGGHIAKSKRNLQTFSSGYGATSAARRLARKMEAAEDEEFMGLNSLNDNCLARNERGSTEERNSWFGNALRDDEDYQTRSRLSVAVPPNTPDNGNEQPKSEHMSGGTSTTEVLLSSLEQIRSLYEQGQAIDAAQLFLDTHPISLKGISSERRELGIQIFLMNCKEGNVFIARSIFERIEAVDRVSRYMWKILIVALAKKGCIDSVATLYIRYRNWMPLPPYLIDIVLRCLIESNRLTTAKWLLYGSIKHDRNCGLCGLFLHGLWKKTRNVELLNGQLKKLLSLLPGFGKKPTAKLFNPVLKAYVDFGRVTDAEALVEDMQTKYGIPLKCRTKGMLVYSRALECDWDAVERGLQEMYDLGFTNSWVDFIRIFDRIFLEYWVGHSGTAIKDFIFRSVEKYGIVPDRILYQHMLEALVEKGNMDMITEFMQLARTRKWNISIDEQKFIEVLRSRRLARESSPVGSWQMLQAARVKYGQSAVSRQLLGFDRRSVPIQEVNLMPITGAMIPWYKRSMEEVLPSRPVDQFQPLDRQMARFMHAGKLREALNCFRNAKAAKLQLTPLHVELAVIATLVEDGLTAARELVHEEWDNVRHLSPFFPLFFRQVTEADPNAEAELIKTAIFRYYGLCWDHPMLLVKHHLMASTCRRLITQNKPEEALDVLKLAYMSRWGRRDKFGGTCMKMFVRAFQATNKIKGVRWCIITGLCRGSALNKDFVVEVRRVIAALKLQSKPIHKRRARERAMYLKYLDFLASLLERKCEGDPSLSELHGNRTEKLFARKRYEWPIVADRLQCDFASVQQVVKSWDEEFELDKLFGRIHPNPEVTAALWDESRVVQGEDYFVEDVPWVDSQFISAGQ
jgi:hypothetical protein